MIQQLVCTWSLVLGSAHVKDTSTPVFSIGTALLCLLPGLGQCPLNLVLPVNPALSRSSHPSFCGVRVKTHDLFRQSTVINPQDVPEPPQSTFLDNGFQFLQSCLLPVFSNFGFSTRCPVSVAQICDVLLVRTSVNNYEMYY